MNNNVPFPSKKEVEKYLNKWDDRENTVLHENALDKLFLETYPKNDDINEVLVKACTLNDFYYTNIMSIVPVAKHIIDIKTDERLAKNDTSLVNDMAKLNISGVDKNFYSFATKYCSRHNPKEFPIYDSYVDKCLMYFKRKDNFANFVKKDLRDYSKFKNILIQFKKFYNIDEYDLKDIDMYLWQLGKDYFPKDFSRKKDS